MSKNRMLAALSSVLIISLAGEVIAVGDDAWRFHSREANGDVHFFDASRVTSAATRHTVWTRIRYKNSVMGASSYQGLLEIDCSDRTKRILQRTFFSDGDWRRPAMGTDRKAKPKRAIVDGSAEARLSEILCDE